MLPNEMWTAIFGFVCELADWFNVMCTCKKFLEIGRKAFDPSFNGSMILWHAYLNGQKTAVEYLLSDPRIDVRGSNSLCLLLAIDRMDDDMIDELLKHPRADVDRALSQACRTGKLDLVKRILKDERVTFQNELDICLDAALEFKRMDIAREIATHLGIYNPTNPQPFTVTIQ